MKIEDYRKFVNGIYCGHRIRDNNGRAGWLNSIDKDGFNCISYRFDNSSCWRCQEIVLDDSLQIG